MVVETDRLVLRPFENADAKAVSFYADPDVMRFIPRGPWPREELDAGFARMVEHRRRQWASLGFGMWAIVLKAAGAVIGHCGLGRLPDSDDVEVYYLLDRPYWNQGIATEAACAAIHFGFTQAGLSRIVAIAMPKNIGSRRVMEKAGMRELGPARHYDVDVIEYEIAREDNARGGEEK